MLDSDRAGAHGGRRNATVSSRRAALKALCRACGIGLALVRNMLRTLFSASLAGAMSTLAVGCYATASTGGPPPPPAYQVTAAPVQAPPADDIAYEAPPAQIETYPSVMFEGQLHYYVNGRWFLRTQRGWGYRRQEPPQLAQHRPRPRQEPRREEEHREWRRDERR